MKNWDVQLSTILNGALRPLEYSLFYSDNSSEDYQMVYSNTDKYSEKESWDLYSIPSLVRVLTLKNQIVSEACLETFYKEAATEICFVLEWDTKVRKVIVFKTENPKVFDQEVFIEAINNEQESLKKLFNRILFS